MEVDGKWSGDGKVEQKERKKKKQQVIQPVMRTHGRGRRKKKSQARKLPQQEITPAGNYLRALCKLNPVWIELFLKSNALLTYIL